MSPTMDENEHSRRFVQFTDDELAALDAAVWISRSPLLGTLPDEIETERHRRIDWEKAL